MGLSARVETPQVRSVTMDGASPFVRKRVVGPQSAKSVGATVGTLDFARVGNLSIGRFASSHTCTTQHPVALTPSARKSVFLAVQLKGRTSVEQCGRTMRLAPGAWGLCDAPTPCVSSHTEDVDQLHLLIPRESVRLAVDTRFIVCRPFAEQSRISDLMCRTIVSLFEELPQLGPRHSVDLADIALNLFHMALTERIQQPEGASAREALRERINAYVESRLRDSSLSLDQIATDLHCTKRYLHMAFANEDRSLNEYIWDRRLERCRQDLENPMLRARSITETAMSWGFSNLSHFSRAFRDRFDMTPRAARDTARIANSRQA
jgi:AraC-like DNA-binding protein